MCFVLKGSQWCFTRMLRSYRGYNGFCCQFIIGACCLPVQNLSKYHSGYSMMVVPDHWRSQGCAAGVCVSAGWGSRRISDWCYLHLLLIELPNPVPWSHQTLVTLPGLGQVRVETPVVHKKMSDKALGTALPRAADISCFWKRMKDLGGGGCSVWLGSLQ